MAEYDSSLGSSAMIDEVTTVVDSEAFVSIIRGNVSLKPATFCIVASIPLSLGIMGSS